MSDQFKEELRGAFEEMSGMPNTDFNRRVSENVRALEVDSGTRVPWALAAVAGVLVLAVVGTFTVLGGHGLGSPRAAAPGVTSPSPQGQATPQVTPAVSPVATPTPVTTADPTGGPFLCAAGSTVNQTYDFTAPGRALVVQDARAGQQSGFDRFVLEYKGDVTSIKVSEVSGSTFTQDGSGQQVSLDGTQGLRVVITGFNVSSTSPTDLKPAFDQLREARQMGAFEGTITWGLGLSATGCFRVTTLTGPSRIVVDVHR